MAPAAGRPAAQSAHSLSVISHPRMNIEELKVKLKALGISPSSYSLEGGMPSERYCLSNESGKWFVYYCERGQKSGESSFTNESQACEFLLGQLEGDPTTRV